MYGVQAVSCFSVAFMMKDLGLMLSVRFTALCLSNFFFLVRFGILLKTENHQLNYCTSSVEISSASASSIRFAAARCEYHTYDMFEIHMLTPVTSETFVSSKAIVEFQSESLWQTCLFHVDFNLKN